MGLDPWKRATVDLRLHVTAVWPEAKSRKSCRVCRGICCRTQTFKVDRMSVCCGWHRTAPPPPPGPYAAMSVGIIS